MSETITPAVSDRICKHMNDDHPDAVLTYAQFFGHTEAATAAKMDSIDPQGMSLTAEVDGASVPVRVTFNQPLEGAKDAHTVLVDMMKEARGQTS